MVQGQVFLKGGQDFFLFNFFKVCHFYIKKLLYPLQNCIMHLKKKKIFSYHNFMKKSYSKLYKNEPENILIKITYLWRDLKD